MSFISKNDYFSLADTALACVASNDGASASVAEAKDAEGAIVAHTVYGATKAPSCDYVLKAAWTKAANALKLGAVSGTTDKIMLASVTINTAAGSAPTVSASGEQVESTATTGCTFGIPAISLPKTHHAHILFSAFTLGGTGCHLQSANYTASASVTKATKDGDCVASDIVEGKIEAQVTIVQTGSATPTLTAGSDFTVTSPLTCSNPDADYPTWTATLTKYLAKTEPSSAA